jgi:hypothetical protein
MDAQQTCARCGAPVTGGRFCGQCGAPIAPAPDTSPSPTGPPQEPAYDVSSTADRLQPVPPAPSPVFDETAYAPVYAEPASQRPGPGVGLWIGAGAGLLAVLLLGAFLLLSGGSGGSPSASSTPLIPVTADAGSSAASSAPSSAPTTASSPTSATPTPQGPASEVAGQATASAPAHAPDAVDFAGNHVTYVAPNMVDGVVDTCWRTPGGATGMVLTFRLPRPTSISKVGLVNGYAKTAFSGGRRYDWYAGDRRVLAVDWLFDDGSSVSQTLSETRAMQTMAVRPVTTSTVRLRITSVSPPGRGPAARNDTAISEVSLVGATS